MSAIAKPLTSFTGSLSSGKQFVPVEQVVSCEKADTTALNGQPATYGILFTYINGSSQRILWSTSGARDTSLAAFIAAFSTATA